MMDGVLATAWRGRPIGLDVGSRRVKAVQLCRRRGGGWSLLAAASFERFRPGEPLDEQEVCRIAEVLRRRGFAGSAVNLAMPRQSMRSELIDVPPRESSAPVDLIVEAELARAQRLEPGSFTTAYWEVPGGSSTQVMASACPIEMIERTLSCFDAAGLEVVAAEPDSVVLARVASALGVGGLTTMIDVGWSASSVVLLSDDVVMYERMAADASIAAMVERVGDALGLEPEVAERLLARELAGTGDEDVVPAVHAAARDLVERLVTQVSVSLEYGQRQIGTDEDGRLLIAGGGSALGRVVGLVAESTGLEALRPMVAQIASNPRSGRLRAVAGDSSLTAALGAAMRGSGGAS